MPPAKATAKAPTTATAGKAKAKAPPPPPPSRVPQGKAKQQQQHQQQPRGAAASRARRDEDEEEEEDDDEDEDEDEAARLERLEREFAEEEDDDEEDEEEEDDDDNNNNNEEEEEEEDEQDDEEEDETQAKAKAHPAAAYFAAEDASDDDDDDSEEEEEEDEPTPTPASGASHVMMDAGLLAAFDPSPTPHLVLGKRPTPDQMKDDAVAVQELVSGLFSLERGESGEKRLVKLPPPRTRLPRQKPLPKPKPETRWEKFAREKGIVKSKKRSRLVLDEETKEYKPRFGKDRANANEPQVIELKPGDPLDVDPFQRHRDEKKMKLLKQKGRELKNQERAARETGGGGKKAARPALGDYLAITPETRKGMKSTKDSLRLVQTATASFGRFDKRAKDEAAPKIGDKRRKFAPNLPATKSLSEERERNLRLLEKL